ncbi:MAG: M20 family metallo-hydrolase [Candidatus Bathyarchaeota archaeon]|nr:M20 family metallo-hydrolase [Candidatus Bathyarchaeota archaeon]
MVVDVKLDDVLSEVEGLRSEMVQTLMELVRVPAIAPENGGEGELEKAEVLMRVLEETGFDRIERYDAKDGRVPSGVRPNIVAYYYGEDLENRLWIVTHMDVVPPGDSSLWTVTRPFEPVVKDGRVYGRGSEDNGQALVASIFAVKALRNLGVKPKRTVALAFVADEEQGSRYGIRYLVERGLFGKDDLIVVPDHGNGEGSFIEVAEKSGLWLRVRTRGKQVHASTPEKGLNAHRIGMRYALALDKLLHEKYSKRNEVFEPPGSTFEPTKKDGNVDAVNIIPGEDVFYFDCRVLPEYSLDEVLSDVHGLAEEFEEESGAEIVVETVIKSDAPEPTPVDSEVVSLLRKAIKRCRGIEPKVGGIGGGTCAAHFRRAGIPAVVWSTVDETAHQPNEYVRIENLVGDSKVFALLALC